MKDDLEARERGLKRAAEEGDEEKAARDLRRSAEDGKRWRKEREAALKTDLAEETPKLRVSWRPPLNLSDHRPECSPAAASGHSPTAGLDAQAGVSDLNRTLVVKWPRAEPNPLGCDELIERRSPKRGYTQSCQENSHGQRQKEESGHGLHAPVCLGRKRTKGYQGIQKLGRSTMEYVGFAQLGLHQSARIH